MLIIRKNEVNNLIATVSMNKTLSNPYYLFSFQHIASKERVSFLPQVITSNCRYDKFRFTESTTTNLSQVPPRVNFPYLGQYYYSIYEQLTSSNTNPELAFNKLESGRAVVIVGNDNPDDCFFEPYISNDENFANVIYVSEEEQECIDTVSCCISNALLALVAPVQLTAIDGFTGSNYIAARRIRPQFEYNSQEYVYLMRVTENGEYDNSFNVTSIPLFSGNVENYSVSQEKVAFSLRANNPFAGLYVLDNNGSLLQSLTGFSHITNILVTQPFQLLSDNSIIVFGSFSGYNSTNLYGVAKFDSNGNLDPASSSNGFSNLPNLQITMENANLFLDNNGKLLLVFDRTTILQSYNGNSVGNIFRVNDDLSYDSTFNISTASISVAGGGLYPPKASFTNDDKIIISWNLPSYSGHASPFVIILNNDGSVFTDFVSPIPYIGSSVVHGTLVEDDKFYIFGSFDNYSGSGNNAIVKVDFSGNIDTSFVSQANTAANIVGMHKLDDGNYLLLRSSGAYANYVDSVIKIDRYGNPLMCDIAPTPTPTPTPSITPTLTNTPTLTSTPTLTGTPPLTPTVTSTPTLTSTATLTPTVTPTLTQTLTPTASQGPWTPNNFTGIWDWWTSDYGVNVINTDDVNQWTGHNGNVLTAFNTGQYPKKINSDSDFNNEPSIELNPNQVSADVGMSTNNNANNTSKTLLLVGYVDNWSIGIDSQLVSINPNVTPRMAIWASNTQYLTYFNDGLGDDVVYAGSKASAPTYQFVKMSYDRSTGDYIYGASDINDFNSNIDTRAGQTNRNYTGGIFGLCNYAGVYGFTPNIRVVEFIVIDGVPTTTEYNNYEAYLTTKYGI